MSGGREKPGGGDDGAGDRSGCLGEREMREERERERERERKKKADAGLKFPPVAPTGLARLVEMHCKVAELPVMPQ
jgi:hypothetical protein